MTDAWQQAARENNAYWQREASKAYAERRDGIRKALRENGGREEPWMRFHITPADLDEMLEGKKLPRRGK